jgi:hypothetical protein
LRGNSRLKSLSLQISIDVEASNQAVHTIADALRENKGLLRLDFRFHSSVSDEAWYAVCNSLETHPTLQVLKFIARYPAIVSAKLRSRIQALVDMLKVNTSMHTINLDIPYTEHELFQQSVIPHRETNRFRSRLLAIQKTLPIAYRTKVLGRALLATRTDANSFWMLLSGNAEVAFPARTTTIAAAAKLPTPFTTAATAATSTANVAVADSAMSALMTTATDALPPVVAAAATSATIPSTPSASDALASAAAVAATAYAATPSAGRKRKACP